MEDTTTTMTLGNRIASYYGFRSDGPRQMSTEDDIVFFFDGYLIRIEPDPVSFLYNSTKFRIGDTEASLQILEALW